MTPDQLELLSDMVADKVFTRFREYLEDNKGFLANFEPLGPEEFFNKNIDAFGNIKHGITPHLPSKKELLSLVMYTLSLKLSKRLFELLGRTL